jgi:NitT/TauT family transport system substrate-binding protein
LAASRNLWATLPIIAQENGYFAEEGLQVNIEYVQAARFAMDALAAGQTDFATLVDLNVAFAGYAGNEDLSVIATVAHSRDSAIVARRSAGIQRPQDLAGKRIGVLPGTSSQIFADRFLAQHGVARDRVSAQNLQPIAIQTALVDGSIDAGSVWQPFVHNIVAALGADNVVVFEDLQAYTGYMNIAVRRSWAAENSETAQAFLRALVRARDFVRDNPTEAQAIMAREINLDPAIVQAIWPQYDFVVELDAANLQQVVTEEGAWIRETQEGFSDRTVPSYEGYFDRGPLTAAER